jgi:hypothetical protein
MKSSTPKNSSPVSANMAQLQARAKELRLAGLLAHWDTLVCDPDRMAWVTELLGCEETERDQRSLERRLRASHIGKFKPLADYEWDWPRRCDRQAITAGQLLGELAALDSDSALRRRLKHYAAPDLLLIDEVGYLSYSNRHADLLFELISRRYEQKSTVITTNRAFKEWHEVFPNAACVVSLIDRLVHRCEIVVIEGESYRLKEAKARSEKKAASRAAAPGRGKKV